MTSEKDAFIKAFSTYLESLHLGQGWYDFNVKILKTKDRQTKGNSYVYVRECLVKSSEREIIKNDGKQK